jgi:hypothetical protein
MHLKGTAYACPTPSGVHSQGSNFHSPILYVSQSPEPGFLNSGFIFSMLSYTFRLKNQFKTQLLNLFSAYLLLAKTSLIASWHLQRTNWIAHFGLSGVCGRVSR